MSWLPGWDSVAGTALWSNIYFWLSIISLIGLGVFEVASHRYSERKDELVTIEQEAIQRRHDEDMARVQHDTAQAIERAAQLEKDAELARAGIAEANARAAEAQLALEKYKAPRTLSVDQQSRIVAKLQPFAGTRFDMAMISSDPEAFFFLRQLVHVLETASWSWIEFNHPTGPFMTIAQYAGKPNIGYITRVGVSVEVHSDHKAEFSEAAKALGDALNAEGITAGEVPEPTADIPNHDTVHIIVGRKFP